MIFHTTPIAGVAIIDLEERSDDRGFFARSFDRAEFDAAGLDPHIEQANVSFNHRRARCGACTSRSRRARRRS